MAVFVVRIYVLWYDGRINAGFGGERLCVLRLKPDKRGGTLWILIYRKSTEG
jgi:hypothetical protein